MNLKIWLKKHWNFLNFFRKITKKGKELMRVVKIIENEYSSSKIFFKAAKINNLSKLFGYVQETLVKRGSAENLEKTFYFQEKESSKKLKLLNFSLNYAKMCRNRLKPFLKFSKLIFSQKNRKFFSGYFKQKEKNLIRTFKLKRLKREETKNKLWEMIRSLKNH